jgi:hypothetical protein
MRTICSFCNTLIRSGVSPDEPVSHGICPSCYQRIMTEHGFNARKFLDMLDAPIFLVDGDVNVLAANSLAVAMAKKPIARVRGNICGKVLDCIHTRLPGGCGKTPFCPDCTIRNSVNLTYTTGKPVEKRPAVICRKVNGTEEEVHLIVSTRIDNNIVLLRLEPVEAV